MNRYFHGSDVSANSFIRSILARDDSNSPSISPFYDPDVRNTESRFSPQDFDLQHFLQPIKNDSCSEFHPFHDPKSSDCLFPHVVRLPRGRGEELRLPPIVTRKKSPSRSQDRQHRETIYRRPMQQRLARQYEYRDWSDSPKLQRTPRSPGGPFGAGFQNCFLDQDSRTRSTLHQISKDQETFRVRLDPGNLPARLIIGYDRNPRKRKKRKRPERVNRLAQLPPLNLNLENKRTKVITKRIVENKVVFLSHHHRPGAKSRKMNRKRVPRRIRPLRRKAKTREDVRRRREPVCDPDDEKDGRFLTREQRLESLVHEIGALQEKQSRRIAERKTKKPRPISVV